MSATILSLHTHPLARARGAALAVTLAARRSGLGVTAIRRLSNDAQRAVLAGHSAAGVVSDALRRLQRRGRAPDCA